MDLFEFTDSLVYRVGFRAAKIHREMLSQEIKIKAKLNKSKKDKEGKEKKEIFSEILERELAQQLTQVLLIAPTQQLTSI